MNSQSTGVSPANNESPAHDLFALTDEQILEIEQDIVPASGIGDAQTAPVGATLGSPANPSGAATGGASPASAQAVSLANSPHSAPAGSTQVSAATEHGSRSTEHDSPPPKWLAGLMADPQSGAEARELWTGIQQARQEAAAFREVFAKPEEARAAAGRARTLDEIDAAFYGGAGKSAQEISAARAALAQRLMREDPAAFREMVFAGLRALETGATEAQRHREEPRGTVSVSPNPGSAVGAALGSPDTGGASLPGQAGLAPAAPLLDEAPTINSQAAAYRAFEKCANEDLERSVGGAIDRTLAQALPNARGENERPAVGARHAVPVQQKLSSAIREEIEAILKGDRQLGEQVTQILAARRFDDTTRAQVVRLINDRAQQLVPVAAKRVINDWTQATLAAHRSKTQKTENGAARTGLAPAERGEAPSLHSGNAGRSVSSSDSTPGRRNDNAASAARIDYRKLSDEQILDL